MDVSALCALVVGGAAAGAGEVSLRLRQRGWRVFEAADLSSGIQAAANEHVRLMVVCQPARSGGDIMAGAAETAANFPRPRASDGPASLVGNSERMHGLRHYVGKLARADSPVLILGETGTGKELVARALHEMSGRSSKPFVALNCAAIPESLLESELFGFERGAFTGAVGRRDGRLVEAEGGTVLLDEIGEMPLAAQAKLLRILETKEVTRLGGGAPVRLDLRFVAATNRRLEDRVREGSFRPDLYYRLAVTTVDLPPLRERAVDIPALLAHFLTQFNIRTGAHIEGFAADALELLLRHEWPGNVRELKNLVEAVGVERSEGLVTPGDLPVWFLHAIAPAPPGQPSERSSILVALEQTKWNKSQAAKRLGWSRMTLYRRLSHYHLERATAPAAARLSQ